MNNNIVWQNRLVNYEHRIEVTGHKGIIVWFTGLSGSGKSTIAIELEKKLNDEKKIVYLLDGDNIRHGINSDLGFSDRDRNENIRRISEIAALFQDAGVITLVSFISPFRDMRRYAREKVGRNEFIEVYVKADIETCIKRDPKGLYQKKIDNFTGISSSYESPENPEVILDTEADSIQECVEKVYLSITEHLS